MKIDKEVEIRFYKKFPRGEVLPCLRLLDFIAEELNNRDEERRLWEHREKVTLQEELDAYSDWLHKKGYIDTDYYVEEPKAVEEYLRTK